jgi:tRNA pseudouridine13 synthase
MASQSASGEREVDVSAGELKEKDIGIYEFVHEEVRGTGGRVKSRFSDFKVREVREDESIVKWDPKGCELHELQELEGAGDEPSYLKFVVHKAQRETSDAVAALSDETGLPRGAFSFAGLKDCVAVTTQEMTVHCSYEEEMKELMGFKDDHMLVGHLSRTHRKLRPGRSKGNHFDIIIRAMECSAEEAKVAMQTVQQCGFINYFGSQRFGKTATRNTAVGKAYLKREYAVAVDSILGPQPWGAVSRGELQARSTWRRTRDAHVTVRNMPKGLKTEHELLQNLVRHSDSTSDHEELCRLAFLSLPLQLRTLCASAYFNYIWNLMASER